MIYFDNAATGFPKSKSVISATEKAMYISGNSGRSGHIYSIRASEILYSVRESIAELFGTSSERIILCPSATYALNIGIKGLKKEIQKYLFPIWSIIQLLDLHLLKSQPYFSRLILMMIEKLLKILNRHYLAIQQIKYLSL